MAKQQSAGSPPPHQHVRPQSLRDWICHFFHRAATTRVPHWDSTAPPDLPQFDVEAEWAVVAAQITRPPLDEGHGDIIDRLVEPRVRGYQQEIDRLLKEQQAVMELSRQQGQQHLVRLGEEIRALRITRAAHAERIATAWQELTGTPRDEAYTNPERAVPIDTQPATPEPSELEPTLPEPIDPDPTDEEPRRPNLHSVRPDDTTEAEEA